MYYDLKQNVIDGFFHAYIKRQRIFIKLYFGLRVLKIEFMCILLIDTIKIIHL